MVSAAFETDSLRDMDELMGMDFTADISYIKISLEDGSSFQAPPGTHLHFDRQANAFGLELSKAPANEKVWEVALKAAKGISFSSKEPIEIWRNEAGETTIEVKSPAVIQLFKLFTFYKKDGITLVPRKGDTGVHFNGKVLEKSITIPSDAYFVPRKIMV